MLTVRVVALEYSQLHKKPYNLMVCEFGGFENVLRDVGVHATNITSTNVLIVCADSQHKTFTNLYLKQQVNAA